MTGTVSPRSKDAGSSMPATNQISGRNVYDLVHKPELSLLEQQGYVPVSIDGITLIEDKIICVCVTICKENRDGSQQFARRELLKTDYFKKNWPQMLIRFYETRTKVNNKTLSTF